VELCNEVTLDTNHLIRRLRFRRPNVHKNNIVLVGLDIKVFG